ncbi:Gustatory receptor 120a [Halyomorpha halys]|nr:Gustatory receptor 120a [Halyomorpha halys]
MPSTPSNKDASMVALELCWWGKTRQVLEEVFRKPRLTATFPFTNSYDALLWPSVVLDIVGITLSIIGVYYSLNFELDVNIFNVPLIRILKSVLSTTFNTFSPLWMIFNHKYLIKLLKSISSVDKELENASLKWKRKHFGIPFFVLPSIMIIITLAHSVVLYLKLDLLDAFAFVIVIISSCPIMSYLWQYLALHDVLSSLMNRIRELDDANSFVNCYHSLVIAYRSVDQLYGLQILIYFFKGMQSVIHSLHFNFSKNKFDFLFICQILWACFHSIILLLLIRRCNSSVVQSKMVNEQLYKRMVYEDNNNLIHDKLLAFHLSSCRKLVFTACGFFNLDNSLICSMVACATTYLVIMLQFTLPTNLQANNQSFAHF